MVTWIMYIVATVVFLIWFAYNVVRSRKNKSGLSNESKLYEELFDSFDTKSNSFDYKEYSKYANIINNHEIGIIEHTIAIVEGNLQTEGVNSVVMALAPTLFSICSFFLASQLEPLDEGNVEILAKAINLVVLAVYLWLIAPAYVSVKRQKYFLKLMEFQLDKKKNEQQNAHHSEKLLLKIKSLEKEIEDLKRKKTKGIHITIER